VRERLERRELHALRSVVDGLLFGPARRGDARPQVLEVRLGELDRERADGGAAGFPVDGDSHVVLLVGTVVGDATQPEGLIRTSHRSKTPALLTGPLPGPPPTLPERVFLDAQAGTS
jgi:hypothetical protein